MKKETKDITKQKTIHKFRQKYIDKAIPTTKKSKPRKRNQPNIKQKKLDINT